MSKKIEGNAREAGASHWLEQSRPYCRQALQVRPKRLPSRMTRKRMRSNRSTAEKVIDALEGAYGYSGPAPEPHQGGRCTGFLRWKSRSLTYSRSELFRARHWR